MNEILENLNRYWARLSPGQRALMFGLPALLIVAAVAAIALVVSAPPVKAPLFRNLEPADAGRILEQLKKDGVAFSLENGGQDILVPAEDVYEIRLEMAAAGLPQGKVGFELFDKQKLGITETGMRVDMQRALQGELSRTLESLEPVEHASVLLNIAPETSFMDRDARSTASVTLALNGAMALSRAQVEGVRHLVSHAVPRLDPNDVSITDGAGNPLGSLGSGGEDASFLAGLEVTDLQHRFQTKVEHSLEDKIRTVLEGPYGKGNVTPSVTVAIDFRRIHNESENYTPVIGEQGIEKHVEDRRDKTSSDSAPGGVPGTTSNVPGYLGISGGGGGGSGSSKTETIVEYLVNKKVSLEDLPPGAITKRSVAVALATTEFDEASKASVENLVASAIGADISAGDVINVQAFQYTAPAAEGAPEKALASARRSQSISAALGWLIALLVVGIIAFMLRSLIGAAFPKEQFAFAGADGADAFDLGQGPPSDEDDYVLQRLDKLKDNQQSKMRHEIDRMIDSRPEMVANLLRTWMLED
jgi:flagellar M-ring protein FliF